jgi:AraC-like DNA-binding protein
LITDEAGVLSDSEIHIFDPSPVALQSLIYCPFWGDYHCEPPYQIARDQYDALLLFVIASGQIELHVEDQTTILIPGCVHIIDCRQPQRYLALGDCRFTWIHLKGGSSTALFHHLAERAATGFQMEDQPELSRDLSRLLWLLGQNPLNEWAINLSVTQLLTDWAMSSGGMDRPRPPLLEKAHAFMTEHCCEDLSLAEIARQINVSPCHFARLFRRCYQISPHEYLLTLRLSRARRQLLLTDDSVEMVASSCGFHSASHFIRAFGQRTGVTPAQYRRLKF